MKTAGEVVHVNGTATDNGDIIFDVVSAVLWTALTPPVITASVFMLLVLHRSEKDTTHLFLVTINVNILVSCFAFALPVTSARLPEENGSSAAFSVQQRASF